MKPIITIEERLDTLVQYLPYKRGMMRRILLADLKNRRELDFPKEIISHAFAARRTKQRKRVTSRQNT